QLEILIRQSDKTVRLNAAAELQRMIVTDVPVLPMAETSSAYMQHSQLKGVVRRVFGPDPDFSGARVVP
ncbi:MAG: oligopeptide transport system substrate-binding protein, partial [Candidatus Azotimanducaceae bacterium]